MAEFGGEVCCFMSDPDVAETAKNERYNPSRSQYGKGRKA